MSGLGEKHGHAGVGQEVPEALLWVGRVQGHVRRPGLDDTEHADHEIHRPLEAESHPRLGTCPMAPEIARQAVGPRIELAVGEPLAVRSDREPIRRAGGLRLEELSDGGVVRVIGGRGIGFDQKLMPFWFSEQRQVRQPAVGIGDDAVE